MRIVLLAAAAAALAAATGIHDTSASHAKKKCTKEGTIVSYLRTVRRTPCTKNVVGGAPLFRNERVRTGEAGELTFESKHLTRCRIEGRSDATFYPKPGVALRLDAGRIWCEQTPGLGTKIVTKTSVAKITGTLLGIETDGKSTVVKVADGEVTVLATSGLGEPAQLGAGSLVTVRKGEEPDDVDAWGPSSEDEQAITALTQDAPAATIDQVRKAIVKSGEGAAIVGETSALVKRTESKLSSTKVTFLTWSSVDSFLSDSEATARLAEAAVGVVVLVGSPEAMQPVIEQIRADLGADIQIFVVPPSEVSP
jgi:hypothetical protein